MVILRSKLFKLRAFRARLILEQNKRFTMSVQTAAQHEMAQLLVEALNLEDIAAEDIAPDEILFGEGLGLDSIDALEIALAISQKFGVQMQADDAGVRDAFATLASLTDFVQSHKK